MIANHLTIGQLMLRMRVATLTMATLSGAYTDTGRCAQPPKEMASPIPQAMHVEAVAVDGGTTGGLTFPEVTVTDDRQISRILAWLAEVDWQAKPQDTRRLLLPESVKLKLLVPKNKRPELKQKYLEFDLIDGGIIVETRLWKAKTDELESLIRKAKN